MSQLEYDLAECVVHNKEYIVQDIEFEIQIYLLSRPKMTRESVRKFNNQFKNKVIDGIVRYLEKQFDRASYFDIVVIVDEDWLRKLTGEWFFIKEMYK